MVTPICEAGCKNWNVFKDTAEAFRMFLISCEILVQLFPVSQISK